MAKANQDTGEIEPYKRLTQSQLADIGTDAQSIEAFLADIGLTPGAALYAGSEWALTDKADLVEVPLFLVEWWWKASDSYKGKGGSPSEFAIVRGIRTDTGDKVVFTDGGTGVSFQLTEVTRNREQAPTDPRAFQAGLAVPKGLTRSDYGPGLDVDGNERPGGTTYYLG